MMQQTKHNSTVVKSPQRAASIRASSMPRLAVDQQVTKMNYSMFSYQLYVVHSTYSNNYAWMCDFFCCYQSREVLIDSLSFRVIEGLLWLLDVCVTGHISRQKADEALLLHHRGPVCERPLAGAALPGESQSWRHIQASEELQRSTCVTSYSLIHAIFYLQCFYYKAWANLHTLTSFLTFNILISCNKLQVWMSV